MFDQIYRFMTICFVSVFQRHTDEFRQFIYSVDNCKVSSSTKLGQPKYMYMTMIVVCICSSIPYDY